MSGRAEAYLRDAKGVVGESSEEEPDDEESDDGDRPAEVSDQDEKDESGGPKKNQSTAPQGKRPAEDEEDESSERRREVMSAGVGESHDPLFFEHLLNDIPLVTLEETAKKMDKVEFFHGRKQLWTTFDFTQVRECLSGLVVWAKSKGQAQGQELYDANLALQSAMGSKEMAVEGIASLRAWTCTPMCYVLTSLMRSPGRSRKSLDPVLAYAKLLFKSLHALPARFIFVGTLYRSVIGLTDTWKDKKERLDKKEKVRHNFYFPTSFSKNKEIAASFKEDAVENQDARTFFTINGAAGYYLKEFSKYEDEEEVLVEPVCCCNVEKMEIPQDQYPGEYPAGLEGLHTMELRARPGIRLLLCSCVLMLTMV